MPIAPGPAPELDFLPHTPTRKAIGERTATSVREAPHFSITALADCERVVAARLALKAKGADPLPTYNDFILKAVADVIGRHRRFNCWYTEQGLQLLRSVNLGIAVATEAGVLLPTLFDADRKGLGQIAAEAAELGALARAGKLRASLQRYAGFTISNIGPTGVEFFDAIISPPQPGILSVGSLGPRAIVVDGQVAARQCLYLTLTIDHRCADGAEGALFLRDIVGRLQEPFEVD